MAERLYYNVGRAFLGGKEVATLKDISVEYSQSMKGWKGGTTYDLATVVAEEKLSGKVSAGSFDFALIASILNGTTSTGMEVMATEVITAAASVTVSHSSTFVAELGVRDSTGAAMKKVASAPQVGEYAVAAGVYTLNAAQTGKVAISYAYTQTTGSTVEVANRSQFAPTLFELRLWNETKDAYGNTYQLGMKVYAAVFPKLSLALKAGEFGDGGLDFEGKPDATGKVWNYAN